jgi:endoglucanase
MKKSAFLKKLNRILSFLSFLVFSNIVTAQVVNCNTVDCITNALATASPGTEIVIAEGAYAPSGKIKDVLGKFVRFTSAKDGNSTRPIILRGKNPANPPVLKCPDNDKYDGAVISINGDYWILKDLIIKQGAKGIMIDNSNNTKIEKVQVTDIGEEGIHLRDGSSNCIIDNCVITETGKVDPQFGEGVYIGTDRGDHDKYKPDCNNNTVQNCKIGPGVTAEHLDIKEGTDKTIIKNNTFDAIGISGANFSDSFIDVKGIYCFIYNNTFNVNNSAVLTSIIDFNNRTNSSYTYKTGEKVSIFNNTINLSDKGTLPTATSRGAVSKDIHVWSNTRVPNTPYIKDTNTALSIKEYCPTWNIITCTTLATNDFELDSKVKMGPNPVSTLLTINLSGNDTIQEVVFNDFSGRVLLQKSIQANLQEYTFDLSNFPSGLYLVNLKSNEKNWAKKIVKQ